MIHKGNRTRSGTLSNDMQVKVDDLLDDFVTEVNCISDQRNLQRGIARSSIPCSLVIIVDRANISVLAQIKNENLTTMYLSYPEIAISEDKALSVAGWQFCFEDPFVIRFPLEMLDLPKEVRAKDISTIARKHVDSEFMRFIGMLNMLKTRPVFGPPPFVGDNMLCVVLAPKNENEKVFESIKSPLEKRNFVIRRLMAISSSKTTIRETWLSIGEARLVVADLTGRDPDVMYAIALAHAIGKESILIHPQNANSLDVPKAKSVSYKLEDGGIDKLSRDLELVFEESFSTLD